MYGFTSSVCLKKLYFLILGDLLICENELMRNQELCNGKNSGTYVMSNVVLQTYANFEGMFAKSASLHFILTIFFARKLRNVLFQYIGAIGIQSFEEVDNNKKRGASNSLNSGLCAQPRHFQHNIQEV